MENVEILQRAKKAAAHKAIDDYLKDKSVIGICDSLTVEYAVKRLAERVKRENLNVVCIASSLPAKQLIIDHGLVLGDFMNYTEIDFTMNGADEVDEELNVTNHAGTYLSQVKILASFSKEFIILSDYTKFGKKLGGPSKKPIAIEVIPLANKVVAKRIQSKFGGSVKLRAAPKTVKYGPIVNDNGNFILNWDFPNDINNWSKTINEILLIPGVVETGIHTRSVTKAYIGMENGTVKELTQKNG